MVSVFIMKNSICLIIIVQIEYIKLLSQQMAKTFKYHRSSDDIIIHCPSFESFTLRYEHPYFQRPIDYSQIPLIQSHIEQYLSKENPPHLGIICFGYLHGVWYIIDGQHRMLAIENNYRKFINHYNPILREYAYMPFDYKIYIAESMEELRQIFLNCNMNTPMAHWVLENKYVELTRKITVQCQKMEVFKYPDNNSKTCYVQRPKIEINLFIEELQKSKLIKHIQSEQHFWSVFNYLNTYYYNQLQQPKFYKKYVASDNMIQSCDALGYYIGLIKPIGKKQNEEESIFPWMNDVNILRMLGFPE